MRKKLVTTAAAMVVVVVVVLTFLVAPLVLAQQDEGVDIQYAEPNETMVPMVGYPADGSGNADAGFLQYDPQPPPRAYYDCPPLTEPRMLRPCILVTP